MWYSDCKKFDINKGEFMQKKKHNKQMLNPDKGLSVSSIKQLNNEFYKNYFKEYFGIKMTVLLWLINSKEDVIDTITNSDNLKIGLFGLPKGIKFTDSEIEQYVKLELATEYYHCMETFLRLFLAHIEIPECPWLEISRDTNYSNFKNKIKKLAEGKFDFKHKELSIDELFLFVFYGVDDVSKIGCDENNSVKIDNKTAVSILKNYVSKAAQELLTVYDYNAFKHGLAVYAKKSGFALGQPDDKIEENGDSLIFLNKNKDNNRLKWQKTSVFSFLDYRCSMIWIISGLCSNLLNIGDRTYNDCRDEKSILFIGKDDLFDTFLKKSATTNQFDVIFQSYSMGLIYDE